jgi:UDPglucose 6-dehydrogenase
MAYRRTHDVDTAIVRIFNTHGPRMRPNDGRAIPAFASQALTGRPITVAGDGSQTRSIIYVDDLVSGILKLMRSDLAGPVNIGNPHETSVLHLAETIKALTGSSSEIVFIDRPVDDPTVRQPDITLARTALGWEPEIDYEEGLARTLEFSALTQSWCAMTDRPRLTVVGTGYLGATHACAWRSWASRCSGWTSCRRRWPRCRRGGAVLRAGSAGAAAQEPGRGRLRFTTSYEEVGEFGDVHFVCVGTPQKRGEYAADLTYVDAAFESLVPHARAGALLVGKSTVPAGTAERLAQLLAAGRGDEVGLAWNPEFLREGFAVEDTLTPDRLVFGIPAGPAWGAGRAAAAGGVRPGHRRGPGRPADAGGGDRLRDRAAGQGRRERLPGHQDLVHQRDGRGVRGHRRGRDAAEQGAVLRHPHRRPVPARRARVRRRLPAQGHPGVHGPRRGARGRPGAVVPQGGRRDQPAPPGPDDRDRPEVVGGSFGGMRVAVLGAAFKPNSDDIRDSPALDVAASIQKQGAAVCVYDPQAMANAQVKHPELGYRDSALDAARGADVVLHLTEWAEFREMDPDVLGQVVTERRIVDGRNALDPERWRAAGWTYRALGRP